LHNPISSDATATLFKRSNHPNALSKSIHFHQNPTITAFLTFPYEPRTMASSAVQNPPAESKSAKKKRSKAAAGTNGSVSLPTPSEVDSKEDSGLDTKADENGTYEHPYIKELTKHIRNTHKKLTGMQKVDAIIAENPNTSLDDLVAQRKINADQKASVLKKPQLQQQLAGYEEQINQYRKFDSEYQTQLAKQKEDLTSQHEKEIESLKAELQADGKATGEGDLRGGLLVLTQFLRLAAHKRNSPENADSDEARAFEGVLLGVYGGDEKAVDTAIKLMEGTEDNVPSVEGELLPVKCKFVHGKEPSWTVTCSGAPLRYDRS
jgi:hypothetical protein